MTTTNYNVTLPVVGSSVDTWGAISNAAFESFDGIIFTLSGTVGGKFDKAGGTLTGPITGTTATFTQINGPLTGNATTASTLQTARTIALSGPVTASAVSFNGSANITLTTAIADGALSIAKTSGLQTALDAKEPTLDADRKRKITISTSDPSGGSDGDIWMKY